MLYTETVEPGTLSLLKELMGISSLGNFSLVGGTALSLRYGHRQSIDIDLFGYENFDVREVLAVLQQEFGERLVYEGKSARFGIFCYIDDIKVDVVYYPHRLIGKIETIDNIRMYSNADIAAMKIQAILGRGKKKDFWDLFELLHHYTLGQIITWHEEKYPNQMLLISIPQALTYFIDAEESEAPISLRGQTWESVQTFIQEKVREFLR